MSSLRFEQGRQGAPAPQLLISPTAEESEGLISSLHGLWGEDPSSDQVMASVDGGDNPPTSGSDDSGTAAMPRGRKHEADGAPSASSTSLSRRIAAALDDAQRSLARHPRAMKALCSLRAGAVTEKQSQKSEGAARGRDAVEAAATARAAEFDSVFLGFVNRILAVGKREPSAERLVQFVAQFSVKTEAQISGGVKGEENEGELLHDHLALVVLRHLLPQSAARDDAVRFRTMQLIAGIIELFDETFDLEDDWDEIEARGLERLRDSKPHIRQFAVQALARLQDPNDVENPVTKEYLRLLATESSNDVRKAVLSSIGISRITLQEIIARTRDARDELRRHAFLILGSKVHIKVLSIAQRMQLLRDGLSDRDVKVKQACLDMVTNGWLPAREMDAVSLLQKLDVGVGDDMTSTAGDSSTSASATIERLFQEILPLVERKLANAGVDLAQLGPETAIYWRCQALHVHQSSRSTADAYERLDALLPPITDFCQIISAYAEGAVSGDENGSQAVASFVLRQLLQLVSLMDLSDEAGRASLAALMPKLLTIYGRNSAVDETCAVCMLDILESVSESDEHTIEAGISLISKLREPLPPAFEFQSEDQHLVDEELAEALPELRAQVSELELQQQKQEKRGLTAEAEATKEVVQQLRGELQAIEEAVQGTEASSPQFEAFVERDRALRMLTITTTIVRVNDNLPLREEVQELLQSCVLQTQQLFGAHDEEVRCAVFRCLALFCLTDSNNAETYYNLFITAVNHETSAAVKIEATQCLFDMVMIHGQRWRTSPEVGALTSPLAKITEALMELQPDSEEGEDLLLHGFAKLLLARTPLEGSRSATGHANTTPGSKTALSMIKVYKRASNHGRRVSKLVQLFNFFFDPNAARERPAVTQCLSVFFPLFAFAGGDDNRRCIRDAFLPVYHFAVRVMREEHDTTPAKAVNDTLEGIVRYFAHLTDAEQVRAYQRQQHGRRVRGTEIQIEPLHGDIGCALAIDALCAPSSVYCKTSARLLSQASVSTRILSVDQFRRGAETDLEWPVMLERLEANFSDKTTLRAIATLKKSVLRHIGQDMDDIKETERESVTKTCNTFHRARIASIGQDNKKRNSTLDSDEDIFTPTRSALPRRAPSTRKRKTRVDLTEVYESDSSDQTCEESDDGISSPQGSLLGGAVPRQLLTSLTDDESGDESEESMSDSANEEMAVNRSANSSRLSSSSANRSYLSASSGVETPGSKNAKLVEFFAGEFKLDGKPKKRARLIKGASPGLQPGCDQENSFNGNAGRKRRAKPRKKAFDSPSGSDEDVGASSNARSHLGDIDALLYD